MVDECTTVITQGEIGTPGTTVRKVHETHYAAVAFKTMSVRHLAAGGHGGGSRMGARGR